MKKEISQLIDQALKDQINDVNNSFPSIFSREDVKHQLEEFGYGLITIIMEMKEEKSSPNISLEGVEGLSKLLMQYITAKVERLDSEEVVDFNSASFSIGYNNQIEVDAIDYNSDEIISKVEDAVDEALRDFFIPEEEENETPYVKEM